MSIWHWFLPAFIIMGLPQEKSADLQNKILNGTIPSAIRWQAYWEGVETLGSNYRAGDKVEGRIFKTQNHISIFLAQIRLQIDISILGLNPPFESIGIRTLAERTNIEAINNVIRMQAQYGLNCEGQVLSGTKDTKGNKTSNLIAEVRPCIQQETVLSDEILYISLPNLGTPESIQKKELPSDYEDLVVKVRLYLREHMANCGSNISAKIPYYSNTDPHVYVYIQSGGNCSRGVSSYSRAKGRWDFGSFIPDVPLQDIGGIIKKIESNTALTVNP